MNLDHPRGFSLVELMLIIVIMGLMFALSVPAYRNYRETSELKGAKENIIGELRLAREKAIATRKQQEVRFIPNYAGADYHIWSDGAAYPKWSLPGGISYKWSTGTWWRYRMQPSGRCLESGMIILSDTHGNLDTVSVVTSGMILGK